MKMVVARMKNKNVIIWSSLMSAIFSILLLSACSSLSDTDLLIRAIKECNANSCTLNFREIYTNDWTDIYIVDAVMEPSEISKAIGHDCNCEMIYDGSNLVIFIDSAGVVRSHEEPVANVDFTNAYSNGMVHITKDYPLFEVVIAKVGEETVYRLAHVSLPPASLPGPTIK
ncbi:MAG: hypothetical protein LKM36_01965 [Flavobacteriales bacterium]|jgi:hypothetical protein|nr:hypothetical protein [Flavobacteriales bacterium]